MYTFTPAATSTCAFRTGNPPTGTTVLDTVLGVYSGPAGGPYTELACADDGDGADDWLVCSENFYGIINVRENKDLVGPVVLSDALAGHWTAGGPAVGTQFVMP